MSQYIIIGGDGKEYGPVTADEVREWVQAGRANGETRIKPEGAADWSSLRELPELAGDSSGSAAPDLPPMQSTAGETGSTSPTDLLKRDYSVWSAGCFERGWEALMANLGVAIGASAIFGVFIGVLMAFMMIPLVGLLVQLVWMIVNAPIIGGFLYFFIKLNRRQPVEIGDIFSGFSRGFGNLVLLGLVQTLLIILSMLPGLVLIFFSIGGPIIEAIRTGTDPDFMGVNLLMVIAGYGLMILPAVYLGTAWIYSLPLAMDRQIGFWQAMETSRKMVNKHWFQVFFFVLVVGIVGELGLIACCVGALFTVPLAFTIHAAGYDHIFGNRGNQDAPSAPNPPAPPQP